MSGSFNDPKIRAMDVTETEKSPGVVAVYTPFHSLKLYDATQFVPGQQRNVAAILGVSEDNVRVICPFIGGGFGSKPAVWTHSPLTAAAARALNRRAITQAVHVLLGGIIGTPTAFCWPSREEWCKLPVVGARAVIELSKYVLEALRKDEEFILYRGRSKDDASGVLVLSPVVGYPTPECLKQLDHEYSLREELDPTWAARPIGIARHWDRTVLVLEDPGGEPLDRLLGQPMESAGSFALRSALQLCWASSTSKVLSTRILSRPTFWWTLRAARSG